MRQAFTVPKALAAAKPSKPSASCCSPRARLLPKDLSGPATLFKALGDVTRLEILAFLAAAGGEICACEIEEHVKSLSQPTISHHLRMLREAGLVTATRRGTWIYYAIDITARDRLDKLVAIFAV